MLRLWCSECCTCANCTYVQNMCKLLPYLIYVQHVCYLCTQHVLVAHMHATGILHKCFLYVCMLQRAAYMPLAHMQATTVPHMCSLHTCMLLQFCIHAAYTHASYSCSSHVQLAHMHITTVLHTCRLHTHTLHILGMYTAYIRHMKCITCNTIGVHLTVCR